MAACFAPWQLAIGGPEGGAEAFPHAVRERAEEHPRSPGRVLLDFDQSNASNTGNRKAFLARAQAVLPGFARWLR